ncbi:hypothetical protein LC1Hm_0956 [Halomicrobium sp. LC1Hm]|nr:hypothetical protein LC1Hm_0956 [Halomicrobium sp. LC1Hm]
MGLTVAGVVALVSFLVAWITNDRSLDDFRDSRTNDADPEQYLVLGAPVVVLLNELIPAVSSAISGSTYIAAVVTVSVSAAFYLVAHR